MSFWHHTAYHLLTFLWKNKQKKNRGKKVKLQVLALASTFKSTHQCERSLRVMAGGREGRATSTPNLSWHCYQLSSCCLVLLCAQLEAVDVIALRLEVSPLCNSHFLQGLRRSHGINHITETAFYLWSHLAVKAIFPGEYQSQVATSPCGPSLPLSHDLHIHSSVTPGSWGLSAGR